MNANMKRLLIFALVPITVWGIGSTFTKQKIDRIGVNTESQITMEDTTRFNSGTASTVPYLDASKDLVSSSVTPTELGYLSGVSSSIQTQINGKQDPVSGTANEIDFASNIIGIADNPILPGLEGVTIPSGATGDRPVSPNTGQFRWNTDNAEAEIYDGSQWGAVGGGAGGSRLNLLDDPSFEKGVANGSCTGCTATQDTTDYLATPNNEASLKMAFSAASGNYTWTESTSAQYSNVAGVVSAWIKTSASDCHFDELVNGTQSQTVAIGSSDEWKQYIINGTTGTTSYGWRVRCDTAITDDVFVDETFAGAAEPDTFEIGTASLWGSVKWDATTGCNWSRSTTSMGDYAQDLDCDDNSREITGKYNSTNGDAGNADGSYPQIKFSYLDAGDYEFVVRGNFVGVSSQSGCDYRVSDGTNTSSVVRSFNNGSAVTFAVPEFSGRISYSTPQTSGKTFTIQADPFDASECRITTDAVNFEISVYHYPSPQKVVAAKCDGLECINEFSAKVSDTGIVTDENVDWISGNCSTDAGTAQFDCTLTESTANLNCTITGYEASGANVTLATQLTNAGAGVVRYRTVNSTSSAAGLRNSVLTCQRVGSDYKQFDSRFIPVTDNREEIFNIYYQANMWDAATATDEWDHSLAIPAFSTSQYITVSDVSGQTRITNDYDRNINIDICITSLIDANGNVQIYDSSGNSHQAESNKTVTDTANSVCALMSLSPNDYIYVYSSDPVTTRKGSLNMTVRPSDQKAFIGNLTPKEFVQTPGSSMPVLVSAFLTDGTSIATPSEEDDDFINGNCTGDNSGAYTCTFTTDYWNGTPHCWIQSRGGGSWRVGDIVSSSSSSYSITLRDLTNSLADGNFILFCKGKKN